LWRFADRSAACGDAGRGEPAGARPLSGFAHPNLIQNTPFFTTSQGSAADVPFTGGKLQASENRAPESARFSLSKN
jgi:hypothetical protein